MVMTDGSQKSLQGIDVVAKYKRPGDTVMAVLFYEHDENLEVVKHKVETRQKKVGIDVKFIGIQVKIGEDFAMKLINFVNENEELSFDWLVIGSNGLTHEKKSGDELGSTATLILQKSQVNFVIV